MPVSSSAHALGDTPYWDGGAGADFAPQQWPTDSQWIPYTWGNAFIKDPRVLDPSNGGTRPQNYVNVSSGCPDQTLPSMYVYYANDTLFFRWRVEQIPNTYATGPGPGAFSDVSPWKSAQWTVFLDTDGDGFREFGMQLDGSTGMPAWPVDILRTVYSNTLDHNMSPHDRDIFELWHNPTAFVDGTGAGDTTNTILNFHSTNSPDASWPDGPAEVVWDYGTTRAINITDYDPRLAIDKGTTGAQQCGLTQENEYFVDYQIPMGMLGNGTYDFDCQNPTGLFFATANSLTNPFQKDVVANTGYTAVSENCAPYGDQVVLCGPTGPVMVPQPVVDWVTTSTSGCTTTLTAKVRGSIQQSDCSPDITALDFYYYIDSNGDGLENDGGTWQLLGAGTHSATDQTNWTYSWSTAGSGLPAGSYLIGVDTVNSFGYHTWSHLTTPPTPTTINYVNPSPKPGLIYGTNLLSSACGETVIVDKTVIPGTTTVGQNVQFTITVHNNTSSSMSVNSVTDYLPQGAGGNSFTYVSTDGGTMTPGTPGVSGSTVTWNFSPAVTIAAGGTGTIVFTAQAPTVEGTYQNTCGSNVTVTSWGMTKNISCNYVEIVVGAPRLTIAKAASVATSAVGGSITYTITYSNDSPTTATGAFITDVLPAGLTFVSAADGGAYNDTNRTITWNIGTIYGSTGPFTVSFVATVTDPYPPTEPIKLLNTATIDSNETDPLSANVTVIVTGLSRPLLTIQKIGDKIFVDPTRATPADRVTYTIKYSNVGNATATAATITDAVPTGWIYVSSVAGTNCPAGTTTGNPVTSITWNLGNVAVGTTGTCNLILRAEDEANKPYMGENPSTNTASIQATNFTPPVTSSFTVGLTGSGMTCPGQTYYFHNEFLDVGYDGIKEIANINPPSTGPSALYHVNWMSGGCNATPPSYAMVADFYMEPPLVNNGTTAAITSAWYITKTNGNPSNVRVSVFDYNPADGVKTLLASVIHSIKGADQTPQLDSDTFPLSSAPVAGHRLYWTYEGCTTANNQILDVIYYYDGIFTTSNNKLIPTPSRFCYQGLSVVMNKTVDKMTALPGDTLTYSITFGNNGGSDVTGAQIVDTLPAGTTFVSAALNGVAATCSQAGQVITCAVRSNQTPAPAMGTISMGQQGTLVITATVNNPFPAGQYELINYATLTTTQTQPITSSARTVVMTDISISKSVDKTLLYPGDTATFTLTVKNSSGAVISVNISDVLPTDTYFTYVAGSASNGGVYTSGTHTLNWTGLSVPANSSLSVTFQMTVSLTGVPIGTTYKDNTGVVSYGAQQYSNTVTVAIMNNPNINITKSVAPAGPVKAGDTITWNMTVTNSGPQSALGVIVTDPIIAYTKYKVGSLIYQSAVQTDANDPLTDTSYFDAVNNRVVYEVGTLPGGATRTMSFSAIVSKPMPSGTTTLTNIATVASSNTITKQASASINVTDGPAFVLDKYASSIVKSGENVTFTIYYKNTGGATATSVFVTDTLAANLTFVSADHSGTYDSGTGVVTWDLGSVLPDAEGTLHITVTPDVCGTYTNTATIASAQTAPLDSNTTSTVYCALEPTKSTSTPSVTNTSTGTTATYTLTVNNPTSTAATGVQITDNFSSGFSFDAGKTTPAFVESDSTRTATVNPAGVTNHPIWGTWTINPGGSVSITFDAQVDSSVPEGTYENNVACTDTTDSRCLVFDELLTLAEDVTVVVPVDLSVIKTVNIAEPQGTGEGAEFVYTITLTNVGLNHAFKVNLSDLLPAEITYVSDSPSQGSYNSGTSIWDVGRVDRNAVATLTITAYPNDGTAGTTIQNCAYLTSSVPREPSYSEPDDWSCASITPTHVTISGFRAFVEGGRVVVEWETAAERNTVGFYVERYNEKTGEYVRVNKKLLPALITSHAGGTYRMIDEAAPASGKHLYRLLEVETRGNLVTYGPFSSDMGGSAALKVEKKFVSGDTIELTIRRKVVSSGRSSDLSAKGFEQVTGVFSRKARKPSSETTGRFEASKTTQASAIKTAISLTGTAVKMSVSEDGLYYIDSSDIAAMLNILQSTVQEKIGNGTFALTAGGRQVAYTQAQGNAGIFFYGKAIESVYTNDNIYWLKEGNGLLMQTVNGDNQTLQGVAADSFIDTLHVEQDVMDAPGLAKDPNANYWFWDYVMADYPGFDTKEFSFRADSVSGNPNTAVVKVRLQSVTADRSHAEITLNGTVISDSVWEGLEPQTSVANINQDLLREGDNILGVKSLLDTGVEFSMFFIDSFDVTYARRFEAVNDVLSFRSEGSPVVNVSGFNSPDISVFDITSPQRPRLVTSAEITDLNGSYSVKVYPVRTEASYIAVTSLSVKRADAVADQPSDLKRNNNAADYIVITPAGLKDGAEGLAEYRRSMGMTVKVALLEDIMDEFNFGLKDPNAIRNFLKYAYNNWKNKPRYAVLVGSGTYDYKNSGGYGGNLLPALMVGSPWGLSASDNVLGDFNSDDVPEVIIGRLPVLSSTELQTVLNKIKAFEGAVGEGIILLADKADGGGDFPKDSNDIAGLFAHSYPQRMIYLQDYELAQARTALFDGMNIGTKFINYLGHGTVWSFSEGGLLTKDDAATLTNSAYPVMTALTCASGLYALPGFDSLMEALIIRNGGGIVSSWAPSDWSYNADAKTLGEGFYKAVFQPGAVTMGDAVRKSMLDYKAAGRASYVLNIFSILGDPAMRLK